MYTVRRIYVESKSKITPYLPTEITPAQLQEQVNINTRIYLAIESSKSNDLASVDMCRMLIAHDIVNCSTWEEFNSQLTDALVLGYAAHIPGYIAGTLRYTNPVRVWDVLATLNTFNLDYGKYTTGQYNIPAYRWTLKDLRISLQEGATSFPNLNRCLPIVNGFACRPFYDSDKEVLWAMDGAHLCWHDYTPATPEVQLLDFTELGEVAISSIHFADKYIEERDVLFTELERSSSWLFSFGNYDLNEWTPILVLAGMLILPDQYKVLGSHSFSIDINKFPFNKALVLKQVLQENPLNEAGMAYTTQKPSVYLKTEISEDVSPDCFCFFVKKPRLYVNRETVDSWRNGISVNLYNPEGILINDSTGTIRNHHRETLSDHKELTVQNTEIIRIGDELQDNEQLGFVNPDCRHHKFENINISKFTVLRILGE